MNQHPDLLDAWYALVERERARHQRAMHALNKDLWEAIKQGRIKRTDTRLTDWTPLDMLPFTRTTP